MTASEEINSFRRQIQRFVSFSDEDWNLIVPHLTEKQLKKNQLFAQEGKIAKDIAFVLEGNLRQFYVRDGEDKTTYFCFGTHLVSSYISCVTGEPSQLSNQSLTNSRLLIFSYPVLQSIYAQSKQWEKFGRLIGECISSGLEESKVSLLMLCLEERYHQLMQSNKQKIPGRIPQHYIANYPGIAPASLGRLPNRA